LICARHLINKGYGVMVVGRQGRSGEDLFRREGIQTFTNNSSFLPGALNSLRGDVALLVCESLFAESVFAPIASTFPRSRKILRVHEEVDKTLLAQGLWQYNIQRDLAEVLSEFDLVLFPCEHTKAFYASLARRENHSTRWLVIPNTMNEHMAAHGGPAPKSFKVLQLGTVSKRKNPILTLTAFEIFLHSYNLPDAELVFVGYRDANDRERTHVCSLRKEIEARKLKPYVTIKPTQPSPAQDLSEASVVTLHSSSECSPTVFLEAAFFGKMVIAPDVGGVAELVIDNLNGFLFKCGDCSTQAKLIGHIYEQRQCLPARMPSIRDHYYSHYSNSLFFGRLDAALREMELANR